MEWYFTKNEKPNNDFVDKFADSKFKTNKWNSFAREIIQNSLDAKDDRKHPNDPVKVVFSFQYFKLNEIPGANRILDILKLCLKSDELNTQTKATYENGVKLLNDEKICCLKISDFNTLGVNTDGGKKGLSNGWRALVYDDGISKKTRPGKSAGSHGVGKKVPFIVSGINTVFYSTKNDQNSFFEGKTSLINWTENGQSYDKEGWFGDVNANDKNKQLRVLPIETNYQNNKINDFFLRTKENGTDVIITAISKEVKDIQEAQNKIICAILENFFVAIKTNKLVCSVFNNEINSQNIDQMITTYYKSNKKNFQKIDDYNNLINGNLNDYFRVYQSNPTIIPIEFNGKEYGKIEMHFGLGNEKNKKYYCIFREHGMKIKDVQLNADQPFSAVAIIKDNDNLKDYKQGINFILSCRENPAHDNFIIDDDQFPCDPLSKNLINLIYKKIEDFIQKQTKIEATDETELDSLNDMLSIQGSVGKVKIKQTPKIAHKKKKMRKPSKVDLAKEYEEGTTGVGGGDSTKTPHNGGENKPSVPGTSFNGVLYTKFSKQPKFFNINNKYLLRFIPNGQTGKANIKIQPVSVDGKINDVGDIVEFATQNGNKLAIEHNVIKDVTVEKDKLAQIEIELKNNLVYVLDCEIWLGEKKNA